jgi:hypothetical protein
MWFADDWVKPTLLLVLYIVIEEFGIIIILVIYLFGRVTELIHSACTEMYWDGSEMAL